MNPNLIPLYTRVNIVYDLHFSRPTVIPKHCRQSCTINKPRIRWKTKGSRVLVGINHILFLVWFQLMVQDVEAMGTTMLWTNHGKEHKENTEQGIHCMCCRHMHVATRNGKNREYYHRHTRLSISSIGVVNRGEKLGKNVLFSQQRFVLHIG